MTKWCINQNLSKKNETPKVLWDTEIQTDLLILARRPDLESEKIDKYLNFAREMKKLCNMRMTVIPIVVGALVPKGLERRLEELKIRKNQDHQITTLLRSA